MTTTAVLGVITYCYVAGLGLTFLWLLHRAAKDGERWYAQDTAAAVLWPVFWLAYAAVLLYARLTGANNAVDAADGPYEFDYDDLWYEDEE